MFCKNLFERDVPRNSFLVIFIQINTCQWLLLNKTWIGCLGCIWLHVQIELRPNEAIYLETFLVIGITKGMLIEGLKYSKFNFPSKNVVFKQKVFMKLNWFCVSKNFYATRQAQRNEKIFCRTTSIRKISGTTKMLRILLLN